MRRIIIVIAAQDRETANDFTGEETFTVGLTSLTDSLITHCWCSWLVTEEKYTALNAHFEPIGVVRDGDLINHEQILSNLSLRRYEAGFLSH